MFIPIMDLAAQKTDPLPRWEYTTYPGNQNTDYSDNKYIIKDSLGYIWTYNSSSIERFDGFRFKSYFTHNDINTKNNVLFVYNMYCAKDGELYALSSAGLSKYNREADQFELLMDEFEPYEPGLNADFTFMVEQEGILYISSFTGFYEFDTKKKTWKFYDLTPQFEHKNAHHSRKVIWYVLEDKYNPKLINLFGKSHYFQFDTQTKKIIKKIKYFPYNYMSTHKATQVSSYEFFLSTFGAGVVKLNTKTEKSIEYFNESSKMINGKKFRVVMSSDFVNGHYIATGHDDPIAFIDTATNEVKYLDDLGTRQSDFTTFDGETYWCNIHKGLIKLEEYQHQEYFLDLPKSTNLRFAIPNKDDTFVALIGIDRSLRFFDVKRDKILQLDEYKSCLNIIQDHFTEEFLLEISRGHFIVLNAKDLTYKREINLAFKNEYYNTIVTAQHYIFNNHGNLNIFNKSGNLESTIEIPDKYYYSHQLRTSSISPFRTNQIIMQNLAHLLVIDTETGTFKEYPEFRNQDVVNSYTIDGTDIFTVKSRSGIAKYTYNEKLDSFLQKSIAYNLPAFTTHQNILLNDSLIWLRAKDNVKIFNLKSERFEMDKNFPISYYSIYRPIAASSNGIWISDATDLIKINTPTHYKEIESINLESVETNKRKINEREKVLLHTDESTIKFNWSSPYYGQARTLNFYTLLEGRDDTWESLGENREKLYLGLQPGEYTFHVKASAPGSKIFKEDLIRFEIPPPWYRTWWFYCIQTLIVLGILLSLYKYRLHTITKKNKLDKRIAQLELKALKAQLNPHFIFNSLNSIKRLIQKNENKVAIEYLLLFSSMIRNVLDLSDKKSVTLREELEFSEKYLKMEKLRFKKNFEYEIYFDDGYFLDDYNLPAMILQPHLENAIWHGIMPLEDRNGKVLVNVFETDDYVIIRIEDNGIGRKASYEINAKMKTNIHTSKGQSLSIDRLKLSSLSREQEITTEIVDKDPQSDNTGTIINIKLKK